MDDELAKLAEVDPLAIIAVAMSNEYLLTIAHSSIKQCRGKASASANRLRRMIDEHIQIDGFRKGQASKAIGSPRANVLCQALVDIAVKHQQHQLFAEMLALWAESQVELQLATKKALADRDIPLDGYNGKLITSFDKTLFGPIIENLTQDHPASQKNDIILMIAYATGKLPLLVKDTDRPEMNGKSTMQPAPVLPWNEFYRAIDELAPDNTAWDGDYAEQFTEQVRALAAQKRLERTTGRKLLKQALDLLRTEQAERLEFFKFHTVQTWSATNIAFAEAGNLVHRVDEFRALLAEHRDLQKRIRTAATYDEESTLLDQRTSLVQLIRQLHTELNSLLSAGEPPDIPPSDTSPDSTPHETAPDALLETEIIEPALDVSVEVVEPVTPETPDDAGEILAEALPIAPQETALPEMQAEADSHLARNIAATAEITTQVTEATVDEQPDESAPLPEAPPEPVLVTEIEKQSPVDAAAVAEGTTPETEADLAESEFAVPLESTAKILEVEADSEVMSPADIGMEAGETTPVNVVEATPESFIEPPATVHIPEVRTTEADSATRLLAEAIASDDLPLAYWIARSLKARSEESPVPEWLLAAAYGAQMLTFAHEGVGPLVDELQEIVLLNSLADNQVHQLLAFAASLRPTLLAPNTGLIEWVTNPPVCPALHPLSMVIKQFAENRVMVRPEDISGVVDAHSRERTISDLVAEARTWLRDASTYRPKYVPAANVWRELTGPSGELASMLTIVTEDQRDRVRDLQEQLKSWQNSDDVFERINAIDRVRRGAYWQELYPDLRDRLKRHISDACMLANRWCAIVVKAQTSPTNGRWYFEQTQHLRNEIEHTLPGIWDSLDDLSRDAPPLIAAATITVQHAVAQLCDTLQIPLPSNVSFAVSQAPPALNEGLRQILKHRLWLLPEITTNDQHEPSRETLSQLSYLVASPDVRQRTVEQAIDGWLKLEDYRYIEPLLAGITDEHTHEMLTRRIQEARHTSIAVLRDYIEDCRNKLDLAFADSIIDEVERANETSKLQVIDPATIDDYAYVHGILHQLDRTLDKARDRRIGVLTDQWQDLRARLIQQRQSAEDLALIEQRLNEAFGRRDPRFIEEELDLVRRIASGSSIDDYQRMHTTVSDMGDHQREYLRNRSKLVDELKPGLTTIASRLRAGQNIVMTQPGTAAGAQAFDSWRQLKQTPGTFSAIHLKALFAFLGYDAPELSEEPPAQQFMRRNWAVAQISSARVNSRPIPQFGSLTVKQTIIILWESQESLTSLISRVGVHEKQAILIYLGILNTQQRRDIARIGRGTDKQTPMALAALDEPLLLALAHEPDASLRFRLFLHYSLPHTLLNPYMPNNRGNIASEIFFGRQEPVERIQDPHGSCIIYGGRQLGKSALLYEAGRRFEQRREHYATVEDISMIGEPQEQPPGAIWLRLRNAFRDKFKLTGKVTTERSEDIFGHIRRVFERKPECHVLVMFDEADTFLDADARDRFKVILDLRRLMSETGGRFKVVFAGLHNVQRFAGLPNQPLAQFGAPICIGPLEPPSATALVTQPLMALGYHFRDAASVARILSYTNYHAGLLQIFCDQLLNHLQGRTRSAEPPYIVEQKDIDQTYRHIKRSIEERFDWTLSLDLRYKAIALVLIVDQMVTPHVYAKAYRVDEISDLLDMSWPQGFRDVNDEALRVLLDEMCGLGILVHTPDGGYRLRTPNLVRLLGTDQDIMNKLAQLEQTQPVTDSEITTYHAPLELPETLKRYSPLTYAQERLLNQNRSVVVLVFASAATGLEQLPVAFTRFLSEEARQEFHNLAIPLAEIRGQRIGAWLTRQQEQPTEQAGLIFNARMASNNPDELATVVQQAINWCQQNYTRKPSIRVAFVFDPRATYAWLQLSPERRSQIEADTHGVLVLQPWSEHAIRQRLNLENRLALDNVYQEVFNITGGWPILLDEVSRRCGKNDDPRPAAREVEQELSRPDSVLTTNIWASLGELPDTARRLLNFIRHEFSGDVDLDLIDPDLLGKPLLTHAECAAMIVYLERLGCVRIAQKTVSLDPILHRLLEAS